MKLRIYMILAGLALMMPSCKDFLNPDSISTFDTQYVFSNVDDARKGVNAIYVQFGVDGFRSRLSNNMTGNTDIERSSGWTSCQAATKTETAKQWPKSIFFVHDTKRKRSQTTWPESTIES